MRAARLRILKTYAANRLRADLESSGRGRAAELSRITGFKPSTISNVKDSHRGIGVDLMHALAEKVWQIDTAELERLAYEDSGIRQPPRASTERGPVLSHHPRWPALVEQAKEIAPSVEERFWEEAAVTGLGPTGCPDTLSATEVATIAQALANVAARRRPLPPSSPSPSGTRPVVGQRPLRRASSK